VTRTTLAFRHPAGLIVVSAECDDDRGLLAIAGAAEAVAAERVGARVVWVGFVSVPVVP
jgi:hypothetical protein